MNQNNITKKGTMLAAIAIAMLVGVVGGSTVLNTVKADAQTATATKADKPDSNFDPARGGHVGSNGKKEELLTGESAEKAKAAALSAVPGGKVDRVETDAEGAAYEAHMTKSDGSRVTVKFDSNFKVTGTEDGMGNHTK